MSDEQPLDANETWAHIRDLAHIIVSSFGLPHQIAALVMLTRKTRAHILQWLTAAEALARRMLLIHAATLAKPNAAPPGKAKRLNVNATHGRSGFASDDSEKWSVSFRIAERRSVRRGEARRQNPVGRRSPVTDNALSLAVRIEALIRVCAAPEAYAQRLARRLHAQPAIARRIARPLPQAGRANPAGELLRLAQPLALAAAARFDTG